MNVNPENEIIELCAKILIGYFGQNIKIRKGKYYLTCNHIKLQFYNHSGAITIYPAITYTGKILNWTVPNIAISNPNFPIEEMKKFIEDSTNIVLKNVVQAYNTKAQWYKSKSDRLIKICDNINKLLKHVKNK